MYYVGCACLNNCSSVTILENELVCALRPLPSLHNVSILLFVRSHMFQVEGGRPASMCKQRCCLCVPNMVYSVLCDSSFPQSETSCAMHFNLSRVAETSSIFYFVTEKMGSPKQQKTKYRGRLYKGVFMSTLWGFSS